MSLQWLEVKTCWAADENVLAGSNFKRKGSSDQTLRVVSLEPLAIRPLGKTATQWTTYLCPCKVLMHSFPSSFSKSHTLRVPSADAHTTRVSDNLATL